MLSEEEGLTIARKKFMREIGALQKIKNEIDENLWMVAREIAECPGIIWITAVGTSASIGTRFAHILTCLGVRSIFISPADGLHGHAGIFRHGDIVACISRGGESNDVIEMARIAKSRRTQTIAFVSDTKSALAKVSELVLLVRTSQTDELYGILATTSTVAFAATCDAISAIVGEIREFSPDSFGEIHPRGAVGKQLRGDS